MKTLQQYINEWKASVNTTKFIRDNYCRLTYRIDSEDGIKIFDPSWPLFNEFKNRVYINNERIIIDDSGCTHEEYKPGTYYVEIKGVNDITNCVCMFDGCTQLIELSLFDTSKVKSMYGMFLGCENLKNVPLFNTSKVNNMWGMFAGCKKLKIIPLLDTMNVVNMVGTFEKCESIEETPAHISRQSPFINPSLPALSNH